MICIYTVQDTDYTTNGRAVLTPTLADVNGEAGAKYELDLEVPKEADGKWKLAATEELIVKVPVPPMRTEIAIQGDNCEIWKVSGANQPVRAQPKEEFIITYGGWTSGIGYAPGNRVTYMNHNYELQTALTQAEIHTPPTLNAKWKEIPRTSPGAPILEVLPTGTEFYMLDEYNAYFLHIQTYAGVEGYIAKAACTYVRTISAEDIEPRIITEQLFRIKTVEENGLKSVKDWCQHVSYDNNGVLAGTCVITNAAPASALARIKNAMLWDPNCTIATNLKPEDGSYSATVTKKNLISALLEPTKGFVSYYNARLVRDNWDIFIYKNTERRAALKLTYGGNITAIKVKRDTSKLYTRVRPIAKESDGKTELFLEPTAWVDSPRITDYAAVRMMDLTIDAKVGGDDGDGGTWTREGLQAHMAEKAMECFTRDHVDEPVITMDIDWVALEKTDEYARFEPLGTLSQYDTVEVSVPPMGIEGASLVLANFKWDAIRKKYKTTTFTNVIMRARSSVAGYMLTHGAVSLDNLSQEVRDKLA